jgi:hypothetical protein
LPVSEGAKVQGQRKHERRGQFLVQHRLLAEASRYSNAD